MKMWADTPLRHRSAGSGRQRGVSLIETMVVVAILGILASLAAPSFQGLFESYRVNAARDNLLSSIQYARTEAIRTGSNVRIQRRTDCTPNDWGCGWLLFADLDGDDAQDANEPTARAVERQRGISIASTNAAAANGLTVSSFGQFTGNLALTFEVGPSTNGASPHCVGVIISSGMRARTETGASRCPG